MNGFKTAARAAFLATIGLTSLSSAMAQGFGNTLYWTNSATKPWNSVTNNWSDTNGGASNSTWSNGFDAVFNVANSTITGATINFTSLTANENVTVTGGGTMGQAGQISTLTVASGKTLDFGTQNFLASTFGLIKSGAGTLVLNNANAYTGGFTLSAGTVTIGNVNALGSGGALNLNGGTLQASSALDLSGKYTSINVGGNFAVGGSNALTFSNGVALGGTARTITNSSSANTTFNGVITGTGGLTLNGSGTGTVIFGGNNAYSGGTTVSSGKLQVGAGGATGSLGAGAVTNNGSITFNRNNATVISNAISGSGSLTFNANVGVYSLTGANTYTGTTTIDSGASVQAGNSGTLGTVGTGAITNNGLFVVNRTDAVTLGNTISGSGTVGFGGGGTTTVTGSNTYAGGTQINAGSTVNVGNGGTTGALGSGAVFNEGSLRYNRSNATAVSNTISGAGNVVFSGGGTFTVTGSNSYAGGTTINSGTVLANNGASSLGSGAVTVASGGTLGGNGQVAAPVTVQSGGTIAPGTSPGKLIVNGDVTFQSGSNFAAELNGTVAGTSYDQLAVFGNVDLGGANLLLTLNFVPNSANLFLIDNDGVDAITGIFAGLPEGATVTTTFGAGTYTGKITYLANFDTNSITGGNDVALYSFVTPEPGSLALLGLTLIPGAIMLRRRRK